MASRTAPAARAPAPRVSGRLRRLVGGWVTPQVFDFWAAHCDPTWSWERPLARIVARECASADAVTLWLRPNRHWAGFEAGQHLNLTAEVDGVQVTRSYSLCEPPRADRRIAVTVKQVTGGRLSGHLCRDAGIGDVLALGQAFGAMTLPLPSRDAGPPAAHLFLAAGSGITPLIALIRARAARGVPEPLTLLYWARTRASLCFVEELRALAAAHPRFDVRFVLTGDAAVQDDERSGRLDAAALATLVDALPDRHVLACGPGDFVERARALAAPQAASFRAEAFTPPARAVSDDGTAQVTLAASGRTLRVPRGVPLLGALEAAGLAPAYGCRMGLCNTCACAKSAGATRHLHSGEIGFEPSSALKLCVHGAVSDLVLDL